MDVTLETSTPTRRRPTRASQLPDGGALEYRRQYRKLLRDLLSDTLLRGMRRRGCTAHGLARSSGVHPQTVRDLVAARRDAKDATIRDLVMPLDIEPGARR